MAMASGTIEIANRTVAVRGLRSIAHVRPPAHGKRDGPAAIFSPDGPRSGYGNAMETLGGNTQRDFGALLHARRRSREDDAAITKPAAIPTRMISSPEAPCLRPVASRAKA